MKPSLRRDVDELAGVQDGVVSRRQLMALGLTRWQIVAELRALRWKAHGTQTICVHTADLGRGAMRWFAVIEAGPRAALDGVSALEAAGLTGFTTDHVRLSVPRGTRIVKRPGLVVRQTRRLRPSDVMPVGIRRVRAPVAAIRAALWATSDRQAATILSMVVQQRLATAAALGAELLSIKRHRRRSFLEVVVLDLAGGAQAMGELDFARLCREQGLPAPDRQVVRTTSNGKAYLDAHWHRYRLVVEIDGIHHLKVPAVVSDALRQNALSLASDTVLRLPLLGLRVAADDFMRQVREGLEAGGWSRAA